MKTYIFLAITCLVLQLKSFSQVTSLAQNKSLYFLGLLSSNKAIFYANVDKTLWVSDGTTAGIVYLMFIAGNEIYTQSILIEQ
ncbi:MAG: hypothetical protein MUF24_11310 [Chitinophagaceae bacterium]|nr:hypothetical protein [Chitinophagaceae bacterium]